MQHQETELPNNGITHSPQASGGESHVDATQVWDGRNLLAPHWIAGVYLVGVLLMLLRLCFGLAGGTRLRRTAQLMSDGKLQQLIERQAAAIGLRLTPASAYCEQVAVPAVVGVIRPVILLPFSFIAGITPEQLSNVLAHELAHIRRFDHVAVVVQRLFEAVWFFHPVAWYVSQRVSHERENCCDDIVVASGVERIAYAESLCRVAELSTARQSDVRAPVLVAADGRRRS
jgi:beta-lactamase regulating signal transducer with metallopeptidase domain